jgi:CRP/FNR family transcriptional regulator
MRPACQPAGSGGVDECLLESLAQRQRTLSRLDRLYGVGDEQASLYLVRDGALKTVAFAPDGEEQILAFHLQGELLGLDALETGRHRCDALALGAVTLCELPFDALLVRAAKRPALQAQLCRAIGQSTSRDQQHVEMLIRRQASSRIALFIQDMLERLRPPGETLAELQLPMSREDIARYLGLALETVSRGFTRLQDDGVIRVAGRRVELCQPEVLRQLARRTWV